MRDLAICGSTRRITSASGTRSVAPGLKVERLPANARVLLYLGRLHPKKGLSGSSIPGAKVPIILWRSRGMMREWV